MKSTNRYVNSMEMFASIEQKIKKKDSIVHAWVKKHGLYTCANCGKHPIYVDIRELRFCPYCEINKYSYENDDGKIVPLWTEDEIEQRSVEC